MARSLLRIGLVAAAATLAFAGPLQRPAQAAAFDPDFTWRTLETPHFRVTFHGGEEQLANETAAVAERIWGDMTAELRWDPARKTEIVLVDNTDSANGYAMTLPVNTIVIYVTAPTENSTLSLYEDWMEGILVHEYTHILHLDTAEGLPRLLRYALGRIVSVNRLSPGWVVEGHATLQETWHTTGGRGRSTYVDMIKRMAVLEGPFPPLGNLDGWQRRWPSGNLRYLFGQDLQRYVAERAGRKVWTDFFHMYGGQVVPWVLPDKKALGGELLQYYYGWHAHLLDRYGRQKAAVEADGLTDFRLLSDGVDLCASPTFSPDGSQLVWSCSDPQHGSSIQLAAGDGTGPQTLLDQRYGSDFTWRRDGDALAFSSSHVVNRFNVYNDVYLYEIGGGLRALTNGDRARNPTFSPDGRELVVVTNAAQNNQLRRLTVDQKLEKLTDFTDHTQLSTPRFSPDGRHLAVSMWRDGQRDLWLLDEDAEPVRRVTADVASDTDPCWSADGRTLYFSSDRSGIPNIYAIDLESERLWQVTNVLGGAFGPSVNPAETALVYESYSATGMDIAWMDLDRERWIDRGRLPRPLEHRAPLATVVPADGFEPVEQSDPEPPELKDQRGFWAKLFSPAGPPPPPRNQAEPRATRLPPPPPPVGSSLLDPLRIDGIDAPGLPLGFGAHALHAGDAPDGGVDVDEPTRTDDGAPEEEDYDFDFPVARYDPVPSLLPPRYVVPGVYWTGFGLLGALSTGGTDVMRRHGYSAGLTWRTDSRYLGWNASYTYNRFIPVFSAGASSYTVPYGSVYVYPGPPDDGGAWVPTVEQTAQRYWDRRTAGYLQVSYPVDLYRSVFARWTGSYRQPLTPLDELGQQLGGQIYRPFLPNRGMLSTLSAGWRKSRGQFYNMSISPENARSLGVVAGLSHPAIGSYFLDDTDQWVGFTRLQLTGTWQEYRTLPWLANHVLAWKLAAGVSVGDNERFGAYRLGGSFGDSSFTALPDEWRPLRGFAPATVFGDTYYVGSVEYRLPLLYIDRGVGTIPAFFRDISAAVFLDAGNAFNVSDADASPVGGALMGGGAELRGSAIFLWQVPLSVRAGYAFPLRGPQWSSPLQGFYAWLGTSF